MALLKRSKTTCCDRDREALLCTVHSGLVQRVRGLLLRFFGGLIMFGAQVKRPRLTLVVVPIFSPSLLELLLLLLPLLLYTTA